MYKKVSVTITTTLVIAAILTVSWSALQRSHAQTNGNLADTILKIHNDERKAVNVPALVWSASLAADAQSYAEHLNSLGYSCCTQLLPHATGTGQGENLAWGSPGYSPAAGAQGWANEKSNYHGEPIRTVATRRSGDRSLHTDGLEDSTMRLVAGPLVVTEWIFWCAATARRATTWGRHHIRKAGLLKGNRVLTTLAPNFFWR